MTNKNNISQFDELFKEGLNSLDVQAPAAAFDTISKNLSNNGSVFSKLLASKWIVGTIISIATVSTILVANFENSEKLEPLTVNEAQTKSIETAEKNQIETLW